MFVIMAVATDERASEGLAPIAIGLTVGFCALMGGPLTGASMNPARSFGPALVGGTWTGHWLYWAAPIAAMIVAVRTYELLSPAMPPEETLHRCYQRPDEATMFNRVVGSKGSYESG
jgi:glycerol uptake facilitator-like aquaporin